MKTNIAFAFALLATFTANAANTWYVDDDNYGKEGLDGTSKEKAFGTIQDAIDASTTKDGDTIKVYPGVYDKGTTNLVVTGTDCGPCRVLAHKTVTIESIEGSEKTHIVGEWDPDTESGRGPKAVRCIGQYAKTPTFKGFTIRDGATNSIDADNNGTEDDVGVNRGGAVYSWLGSNPTYIVDCVISNCNSAQGTFRNGCVIRSLVCYNMGTKGVGGMQTTFYSSIITGNKSGGSLISDTNASLSHCTVFGNATYTSVSGVTTAKNNIIVNSFTKSGGTDLSGVSDATISGNALGLEHGEYQLIAPAAGDFRVLKGSASETICAGSPADGSDLVRPVPEEYRNKDFYGNPITENCVAGAVQEVVAAAGGALRFEGLSTAKGVRVNGWRNIKTGAYIFPEKWPVQYLVEPELTEGKLYAWDTSGDHGNFHFPNWNTDSLYLMPPPQIGVVMTNTMMLATGEMWLDPKDGSDSTGDGSEDAPFRTLQRGVDEIRDSNARTFIYCKKGTYAEGGTNYHWGVTNRVLIKSRNVRFVGVDGADETIIEGTPDLTHGSTTRPGCGPAAMRAICVAAGSPIAGFEGFTFRNCYTDSAEEGEANTEGFQGAIFRTTSDSFTLMDCVVSNCASVSSLFTNGRVIRCRVSGVQNISQPCDATIVSGCLFENNASSDTGASGFGAHVTLRNSGGLLENYACVASGGIRANRRYAGCIMHGFNIYTATEGYIADDPRFAATDGAKILRSSPAFTCGEKPTADNYGTNYYKYATTDFYGRPITFVDGKPVAGADQFGVFSMFDKKAFEVSEATPKALETLSGTIEISEGESIKASKSASVDANAPGAWFIRFTVPENGLFAITVNGAEMVYEAGVHGAPSKARQS